MDGPSQKWWKMYFFVSVLETLPTEQRLLYGAEINDYMLVKIIIFIKLQM